MSSLEVPNERKLVSGILRIQNQSRFETKLRVNERESSRAYIAAVIFKAIVFVLEQRDLGDKYIRESIRLNTSNDTEQLNEKDLWIAMCDWVGSVSEKLITFDKDQNYLFPRDMDPLKSIISFQSCVAYALNAPGKASQVQTILAFSYKYLRLKKYSDKQIFDHVLQSHSPTDKLSHRGSWHY